MLDSDHHDPIVRYMAEFGADVLERVNVDFEDAVLLVGQTVGGHPDATRVQVDAIDSTGLDTTVDDPSGSHIVRVEFATQLEAPEDLTNALIELLTRARELAGDDGMTSAEREATVIASYRTFLTRVVAVHDVNEHLRRVTFGGGDLVDFEPVGPDTFLYLLLPPPGRDELTINQGFSWEAHARMPEQDKPVGAYYTLRDWRPESSEMDVLMVLHGDAGHASAWAARAAIGDPVAMWGPRTAYEPPEGTDNLLLVADETGLPAVARIIEDLPDHMTAQVVAEVDRPEEEQPIPERPGVAVTWMYRNGAPAGTTTLLADAVAELAPFDGAPYVWGGGESRAMTAVRRLVRDERGLEREAVSLLAYWRHESTADAEIEEG